MNRNRIPEELACSIAGRSFADYQHGAVIYDSRGIFAWGWNHQIDGVIHYGHFSVHAECHAICRAKRSFNLRHRLCGATIVVYGQSLKSKHFVLSEPCHRCLLAISGVKIFRITYSDPRSSTGWTTVNTVNTGRFR